MPLGVLGWSWPCLVAVHLLEDLWHWTLISAYGICTIIIRASPRRGAESRSLGVFLGILKVT